MNNRTSNIRKPQTEETSMNSSTTNTELPHLTNPSALRSNDLTSGRKSRKQGMILLAALILASVGAYAVDPPPPPAPAAPPAAPAAAPAKPSGAKIQFATPIYDFGKVTAGEAVNYTYIFTNIGTETLQIASVAPSCGCTTAGEWTHSVEPGKTGTIPVRFNSPNYSGPVGKTVTVNCNDPAQPSVVLQIKGTIWQPIDVTPRYAMLNATTESPSTTATVRITNNLEQPLTVSAPESNNRAFEAELKTIKPGKEFEVIVKTVPPLPAGSVSGIITLKTSSTNMAAITITAFANVQPVVTVIPPSIVLPPAPMLQALPSAVTIRNSSTNAMAVSSPTINAKGVDVQLKEVEPGHSFTATLTFPAGFEMAAGDKVELLLASSHPQFPIIKVPVQQTPRPAPVAPPAPVPAPVTSQVVQPPPPPAAK